MQLLKVVLAEVVVGVCGGGVESQNVGGWLKLRYCYYADLGELRQLALLLGRAGNWCVAGRERYILPALSAGTLNGL